MPWLTSEETDQIGLLICTDYCKEHLSSMVTISKDLDEVNDPHKNMVSL